MVRRLLDLPDGPSGAAPVAQIPGIQGNAEDICRNEAELSGTYADDAEQDAVDGGHNPAKPQLAANHDGRNHGKHAGDVVEAEHALLLQRIFQLR